MRAVRLLAIVLLSLFLCNGSALAVITVDGSIAAGEWDGFSHTDPTGTYTSPIATDADNLSEHNGAVDMDMWGAKVENGVFHGMFRLSADAQRDISEYNLMPTPGKDTKIFLGYCIDVDPLNGTGANHSQIDGDWDMMLEIGVDNGQLQDLSLNSMNVWNGATFANPVSVSAGASTAVAFDGKVLEFSVAVSDILGAFNSSDGAVPEDNWLIASRVDGSLRLGVGDYAADIGDIKLMNINGDPLPFGDANLDDVIDTADYTLWAANYSASDDGKTWLEGDFNGDGLVDTADYTMWAANYSTASPAGGMPAEVPEPATMTLLAVGAVALIRRRKQAKTD